MTERVQTPEVSFSLSGEELLLRDEAGGGEIVVEVEGETSLTPASDSWFDVPMDGAVSLETRSIRFPGNIAAWLRDVDGESYGALTEQETEVDGKGTFVDVSAAMKVVAYVEEGPIRGRIHRTATDEAAVVAFDQPTQVVLGARSPHEKPTATITVPDEPEALMEAVSYLGASIKEWSAERSWPTLRGHPPVIELGDERRIPDHLSSPDTGVTVAVPPEPAAVLRVAPLAHYFGADVVPGEQPALRFAGHTEPLGSGAALERSVDELLARGLVLDSLVRIGGYYSLPRYEYDELAPVLPFYPPELYDEPVDRQLLEYLEVPFAEIEPYVPRWSATGTLRPSVGDAEALPYLANSLARVHVTDDGKPRPSTALPAPVDLTVAPAPPEGAAWLPPAGREAVLEYQRRPQERAKVLVVGSERPSESCFTRTNWEFHDMDEVGPALDYRRSVTRDELVAALREDPLYVHYGNRVTPDGFVCSDGVLSFDELPSTSAGALTFDWEGPDATPPPNLLDTVVTACVPGSLSRETAEALGKYLILGFPLAQAVRFAGLDGSVRFLGDPAVSVADRSHGACPAVFDVDPTGDGRYHVSFFTQNTRLDDLGSYGHPSPEKYDTGIPLNGNAVSLNGPVSAEAVAEMATDDTLLWAHGDLPDVVPGESVIHASRAGSGDALGHRTPSGPTRNGRLSRR